MGEDLLTRLENHIRQNGPVIISYNGEVFIASSVWGEEAPDSPMAGGAAHGCAESLMEAIDQLLKDVNL